jgi:two-component system, OmpR family, sensor histidine kinase KdpD
MVNTGRIVALVRWVTAIVALCAIVALYRLWLHVNPTTVALTLLLLVLALAARWGLRYAVATSIAAAALFNYYFLPPVGTFTIADTQNWVALFAFIGTAIIASQLSNRIKEEAEQAKAGKHEVEILFQLSRELLQTQNVAELLNAIPRCVETATGASPVALYLSQGEKLYLSPGSTAQDLEGIDLEASMHLPGIARGEAEEWSLIPLRVGVKPRGVLLIKGGSISEATLEALGSLVSISIDRAEALEGVARGEAARESDRLRTALLDSITHELRTPLTAIKASASALISTADMSSANRLEMLTVIDEESDRLNHLIAQALQMVQLDSHEIHMDFSPQSVAELVENARNGSASVIAGHPFEVRLPQHLPQVPADSNWIERVLSNLLENAAKYSPSGRPIIVSAERRADTVAVSIADRGVGIEPMEQDLIFDKFYRGQSQRYRVSGTGMGLAICRAIVEAHHGTISVVSQPGQGSVFTFTLPAVEPNP